MSPLPCVVYKAVKPFYRRRPLRILQRCVWSFGIPSGKQGTERVPGRRSPPKAAMCLASNLVCLSGDWIPGESDLSSWLGLKGMVIFLFLMGSFSPESVQVDILLRVNPAQQRAHSWSQSKVWVSRGFWLTLFVLYFIKKQKWDFRILGVHF